MRDTIATGKSHTICLKADGTVVAAGNNAYNQYDVADWTDIRLPEAHRRNLQRAWEAYRTLEAQEDDPQAEAILEQCDDLFYAQEADINAALQAYADTLRP